MSNQLHPRGCACGHLTTITSSLAQSQFIVRTSLHSGPPHALIKSRLIQKLHPPARPLCQQGTSQQNKLPTTHPMRFKIGQSFLLFQFPTRAETTHTKKNHLYNQGVTKRSRNEESPTLPRPLFEHTRFQCSPSGAKRNMHKRAARLTTAAYPVGMKGCFKSHSAAQRE